MDGFFRIPFLLLSCGLVHSDELEWMGLEKWRSSVWLQGRWMVQTRARLERRLGNCTASGIEQMIVFV